MSGENEEFEFRYRLEQEQQSRPKVDQIPNNTLPPLPSSPQPGMLQRLYGAGEAGLSALTGAVGGIAGNVAGAFNTMTGGNFGTQEGIRQGQQKAAEVSNAMTFQPRTQAGQESLLSLGDTISSSKIAGIGPAEGIGLLGGAAVASPYVRAAIANSPEVDAVRRGAVRTAQAVLPTPQPEVAALARRAMELDIPIRPDMLTDNKFARIMGEAFEKIPLSGSRAEARQVAFNRALNAEIGGDRNATRLTPDVFRNAMETSGETIGTIAARSPVRLTADATAMLRNRAVQANQFQPADIARVINNYVDELTNHANPAVVNQAGDLAATIPGETFRRINSQIGRQVRTTANGDLRHALHELQDDLHELLTRSITNPQDVAALQQARRQYAIGTALIPLVAKSPVGNISPAQLMNALTNTASRKRFMANGGGEMGDLARIGQLFLKEPASSGTTERAAVYGWLLGGGAFVEPHVAGGLYGAANLYNRAGPSVTRGLLNLAPN